MIVSIFGSQLLQVPFTGSVLVLMKCCPLREQHDSVFSLWYLVVPDLRVYVLHPGVRGACKAKYWRQRHLSHSPFLMSSPFIVALDVVLWCLLRREMWVWLLCVALGS